MKFSIWIAAVAFLLTGCAPISAPPGVDNVTPAIQGEVFRTRDGLSLPMRRWEAEGTPRAILIGLHGMNDYSNAFDLPAKVWSKDGLLTLAYDQRGFGQGPNPGLWAGSDAMRHDFDDFALATRARYPALPIFVVGESMGGAVLLTSLAEPNPPKLAGAILVAPAVWSREDMPLSYRAALFLVAHLLPGLTMTGSGLHILPSDNIPMLRAFSRDPFVIKKTRADAVFGLVNLMDEARQAPDHMTATPPPILLLTGKNDQVIPKPPTDAVIAALGARATVKRYDQGYHMLLRDLEGPKVAQDVADWVRSVWLNRSFSQQNDPVDRSERRTQQNSRPAVISLGPIQETAMESKKHDLRDDMKNKAAPTDTHAQMAGETDAGPQPLKPQSDMHATALTPGSEHLAEGQVTKSN